MTRRMGDAIHVNVGALAAAGPWDLVAGYVTGSPDIVWTAADFARFPGIPIVTIDQGFTGSPVATADVRDVETGAWTAAAAVNRSGWTTARPTIYCNQSTLPSVLSEGWRGDLWLAIVGWQAGEALPSAPGCTIVAVQDQLDVANAYDVSTVIDPFWPLEDAMAVVTAQPNFLWCNKCQGIFYGPNQAQSVCPAGGTHNPQSSSGSLNYALLSAQ
jgi:hypothetical protein